MMGIFCKTTDYGIWHEAFEVKAGKFDTIYGHCPPMMLANCHEVQLRDCKEQHASRGKTDGSDYPTDIAGGTRCEVNGSLHGV